jgi:hypothetical protein
MAVVYNAKGTSYSSFGIGKNGVTIYQGTVTPLNANGVNGDIYFQSGLTPALWQKVDGIWNKIGNFGSKIFTDTTSVDTNEEIGAITVNVNDKRVMDIIETVESIAGEKFTFSVGEGELKIASSDTDGINPVDLVLELQSTGAFKIKSDTDSAIRTTDGSDITVQPGEKTTGVGGGIFLRGGSTTEAGTPGGNINLIPGSGGSGSVPSQVVVPAGYVAAGNTSVVNRFSLTNWNTTFVLSSATYNVELADQLVLVDRAGSTSVFLPTTNVVPIGHIVKIKAANASATVTVTATAGLIDADSSVTLTAWETQTFAWDGARWLKV